MRQYIGARYVPKFMGAYDNTQAYEALSVVDNGLGTSYISKIPTPVGTPLTDTTYWAVYGASSGAIINLQNQIDDINNFDKKLVPFDSDANVVFIGDSWGVQGIRAQLNTVMNFNSYFYSCNGGSGFVAVGDPPAIDRTFENMFTDLCSSMTAAEKDSINYLIVQGGLNDGNYTATLETAIRNFIDTAVTLLPNAQIYILAVNHAVWGDWSRFEYVNCYNNVNGYKGARCADLTKQMQIDQYYNAFHLSDYTTVTNAIINCIKGLPFGAGYGTQALTYEITELGVTGKNIVFKQDNKDIIAEIEGHYWSDAVNGYQGGLYLEFNCPVSGYMPIYDNYTQAMAFNVYPFGGSAWEERSGKITFSPGKFMITIYGPSNSKIQSLLIPAIKIPITW